MTLEEALSTYARVLERLDPENLGELDSFCAHDIRFSDPFNETRGIDAYKRVIAKMFVDLKAFEFKVLDIAIGDEAGYLYWRLTGRTQARGIALDISGVSRIVFDEEGRVQSHVDYWDAASGVYAQLPVIGMLTSWLRRSLAA